MSPHNACSDRYPTARVGVGVDPQSGRATHQFVQLGERTSLLSESPDPVHWESRADRGGRREQGAGSEPADSDAGSTGHQRVLVPIEERGGVRARGTHSKVFGALVHREDFQEQWQVEGPTLRVNVNCCMCDHPGPPISKCPRGGKAGRSVTHAPPLLTLSSSFCSGLRPDVCNC